MDDLLPDILDQCLVRIAEGATVDECLAAYPAQQADLELPLRAAARLRELPRPVLPVGMRAGLETQLLALAAARRAAEPAAVAAPAPPARGLDAILAGVLGALGYAGSARQPWLRLAAAAIAVVLALVLGAGALAAARGIVNLIRPQPTLTPTAVPSPTASPLALIVIDGAIDQIAQEGWVVGGMTVIISSTTSIEGIPALGATAHVRGMPQGSSGFLAYSIVVEQPPTPTAMPAPTAAMTPTVVLSPTLLPAVAPTVVAPTVVPSQPAPADDGASDTIDGAKKPCQGQQLGRDEKKCDPKPHEDKKPPKPKGPKK